MKDEIAVELKGISKVFHPRERSDVAAVNDVNLEIRQGEFFTMLGPSGCGKTTTLRLIAGFETPSSGEIYIQGKPMSTVPPYRRPVNTVFQSYALFPHMTVEQNVSYGLVVKRVAKSEIKRRVKDALALVQMDGFEDRKPGEMSGGQQQRVALARALVNEPAVLLLDEPLGALDLKLRKQMQTELKQLQTRIGITFIYVTHDQEEALTMSDRIAVMNKGRVLQVDNPEMLYERPATKFVADFIGETNFLRCQVEGISGDGVAIRVADATIAMRPDSRLSPSQEAFLAIRPEKLTIAVPGYTNGHGPITPLGGTVDDVMYLGTDTRYLVRLASGEKVAIRVQNTHEHPAHEFYPGAQVKVWYYPDDLRVLTE